MSNLPSLELHAEVETAEGQTYRWDANARNVENRPSGINFSHKIMEGCANGGCVLPRKPGSEWPDLGLYDTLRFVTLAGEVVSEHRVARLAGDTDSEKARIGVLGGSWMSHGRDRPMLPFLYIASGSSGWGGMPQARKDAINGGGSYVPTDGSVADGVVLTRLPQPTWTAGSLPRAEAWFVPPAGAKIGIFDCDVDRAPGADNMEATAAFEWGIYLSTDDEGAVTDYGGDLQPSGASASDSLSASTSDGSFAFVSLLYSVAYATDDSLDRTMLWTPTLHGTHGLTDQGGGYLVSDMIAHSASLYAPLLDTSQLEATTHIVEHAIEYGLIDPYDFWLRLNKYEMRNLAVRPGRILTNQPLSTDTVTWRVRRGDPGTRIQFSGPATENIVNGVIVSYQDVSTMRSTIITPDDDDRLRDDDPRIAANRHGIKAWEPIQLPDPDSEAGAIRYGQLVLGRLNRHRRPGKITISGHIRDDAGNWHQAFKVRDGDTILVEDDEGNAEGVPLIVHECSWNGDAKTESITVDAESQDADALLDQVITEKRTRRVRA